MRTRTGIRPGEWSDNVPSSASLRGFRGSMVAEVAVTTTHKPRERHVGQDPATIRRELEPRPRPARPECGKTLRLTGASCGRLPGHGGDHRSRASLDYRAAVRRQWRPSR